MKRTISAVALCTSLLVLLTLFLYPPVAVTAAKEDVLVKLLRLPAPPPPNPLVSVTRRDEKFYDKNNPPGDNAPIEDLIDYWTYQANNYRGPLSYSVKPSERVVERLADEMAQKPEMVSTLLNILPDNRTTIDLIKGLYDRAESSGDGVNRDDRRQLLEWLRYHSPYFSGDLEHGSQQIKDTGGYVGPGDERNLLALTRHDFDKASPVIDRLYSDRSQPASRSLATWALYQRALETGSLGDVERYRSELMRMVEDRSLPDGARDMANDALTHGPDFPGRDDWTISLFEDETLVNMPRYSMLTTLVMYSPPEKYIPKMLALLGRSSSPVVRSAAVHNLVMAMNANPGPELQQQIVEALLPWLEDPKWATDSGWLNDTRALLIRKLSEHKIPESVPGLMQVLDEKESEISQRNRESSFNAANSAANAMSAAGNAINAAASAMRAANTMKKGSTESYPYRSAAVSALAKQKDMRAVPPLRRVLNEVEGYERYSVINAIFECGGFSIPEQIDALDAAVKKMPDPNASVAAANVAPATNVIISRDYPLPVAVAPQNKPLTPAEIKVILGQQIIQSQEVSDELARAIVDRIELLDGKDPRLATAYRTLILKWKNPVFSVLLIRDLKRDAADADTVVQLLARRKDLREKLPSDVSDLQTGKPVAVGIAACIIEDVSGYDAILDSGDAETKTAMLACARLIRVPLPVAKVAENLKAPSQLLQTAAERYLEAEDSLDARALVLARHPNEAKILGATSAFYVDGAEEESVPYLWELFQSIGNESLYNGWSGSGNDEELKTIEKQLQAEVKKDNELVGVYSYDSNYIRIYKDRVMFSWDEDESRYRERPLTKEEFDEIKSYLTTNNVNELAPFLTCGGDYCNAKELLMLGRSGGRRVYINGSYEGKSASAFFAGLDKYFADLKLTRAALKYSLSREIPGLEILLASDDLHAETVWKNGDDLRVAASEVSVRKNLKAEMDAFNFKAEEAGDSDSDGEKNEASQKSLLESLDKRRYEGYAWYKVANGETAGIAAQPPQVEFIPPRDGIAVRPSDEQWKARAGNVEVRASDDGIYKVAGGKLTKLRKGYFQHAVIAPNGRWAIAQMSDEENGEGLVRVDVTYNHGYPVEIPGYGQNYPVAYISTLNKFLVVRNERYQYEGEYFQEAEDAAPDDADPSGMLLVDPATGATQPVVGEFRPLAQQTFRPLQQTSKPNEYWAAIYDPEKNETQVGIYDTKVFGFKPVLHIPKINFNSMSMWVDEPAGKVYFVYRGHLLALPLQSAVPDRTK